MNYSTSEIQQLQVTKRLKLSTTESLYHYLFVLLFSLVPAMTIYDFFAIYFGSYNGKLTTTELLEGQYPFMLLALLTFCINDAG